MVLVTFTFICEFDDILVKHILSLHYWNILWEKNMKIDQQHTHKNGENHSHDHPKLSLSLSPSQCLGTFVQAHPSQGELSAKPLGAVKIPGDWVSSRL